MQSHPDLSDTLRHLRLAEDQLRRAVRPRRRSGPRREPGAERLTVILERVGGAGDELEALLNERLAETHPEAFYA